jgi:hypothetical protein
MLYLRSKITQKILNLFFSNEKEKFHINELAKLIYESWYFAYNRYILASDKLWRIKLDNHIYRIRNSSKY